MNSFQGDFYEAVLIVALSTSGIAILLGTISRTELHCVRVVFLLNNEKVVSLPHYNAVDMENHVRSPHEVHTKTCTICVETFLNETYIEQHVKSYHEASPFNTDIIRERTLFCDNASDPTPDFCDEQIPHCEQCA